MTVMVAGMLRPGTIEWDLNKVPHIIAQSDHDAIFLQGWVHTQDRFFQMDNLRRTFSGTLAELLGEAALPQDIQLRTLGLRRAAEESIRVLSGASLDWIEAYTDGMNAYLASHSLPPEYAVLELTEAAPWVPLDTITISNGLAFGLAFDLRDINLTEALINFITAGAARGFDGSALFFDDLYRSAPFDPTVSIPNFLNQQGSRQPAANESSVRAPQIDYLRPEILELIQGYREKIAEIPILRDAYFGRRKSGSNWWLASGELTASGSPILANDPHLSLDNPSTFYEIHLTATDSEQGPLNVTGVSFPGGPGVILGCNDIICWDATVNPLDVTDVYQEVVLSTGLFPTDTLFDGVREPLVFIPQTYRVNQLGDGEFNNSANAAVGLLEGAVTAIVPRHNNAPIVAFTQAVDPPQLLGLSVQYTGFGATRELDALRLFQRAQKFSEFEEALQYFDVGSQNWGVASRFEGIAYYTSAEMPIREDLQKLQAPDGGIPPFLVRDGTHTLQHEWLGVENPQPEQSGPFEILPFAEMPQVVNPPKGYIINANNDPIGTTLDNDAFNTLRAGGGVLYLNPGYATGFRAGRIQRLMEEALGAPGNKFTFDQLKGFQANNQLLDAEVFTPFLLEAFQNAGQPQAPAALASLGSDAAITEAVGRLSAWDFSTPTGIEQGYDPGDDPINLSPPTEAEIGASVAATIYSVWRGQMVQAIIDDTLTGLGLVGLGPPSSLALAAIRNMLDNYTVQTGVGASGVNFFQDAEIADPLQARDLILLRSLRSALDLLASDEFAPAFGNSTDQTDYRWGYLHRIVFDHILGGPFNLPPGGGISDLGPALPGVARAGGLGAVDASSHSARADGLNEFMFGSGPVRRFIGAAGPDIWAEQIIPGDQSGTPSEATGTTQLGPISNLEAWLTNQYRPLLLDLNLVIPRSFEFLAPERVQLFFPNYQGDERSFSGFAVSNRSPGALNLNFRTRDNDGLLQEFTLNPHSVRLDAGDQLALLGHEIFEIPSSTLQSGWVDVDVLPEEGFPSTGPPLGSFTLQGDLGLTMLDGGVARSKTVHESVLTRVYEDPATFRGFSATTTLHISNPNAESIDLLLTLVTQGFSPAAGPSSSGSSRGETRTLAAGGRLSESISQIFGDVGPIDDGHVRVRVTSGRGVVASQSILVNDSTLIELNAVSGNGLASFFSAQMASGPNIFTNLKLINLAAFGRIARTTILSNDGTPASDPMLFTLGPGETLQVDAATLLGRSNTAEAGAGDETIEGSLLVETNGKDIVGDVVFGDPENVEYAAGLTLQNQRFTKAIFSHVANTPGFFTGLALYNPGIAEQATITIEVFDSSGNPTGSGDLTLQPGTRVTGLLPDLAPGTENQAGGFILICATRAIAAQVLFGTGHLSLLAALPPTILQ